MVFREEDTLALLTSYIGAQTHAQRKLCEYIDGSPTPQSPEVQRVVTESIDNVASATAMLNALPNLDARIEAYQTKQAILVILHEQEALIEGLEEEGILGEMECQKFYKRIREERRIKMVEELRKLATKQSLVALFENEKIGDLESNSNSLPEEEEEL